MRPGALETGTLKHKDARRVWVFKRYPGRNDNLLCAAVLLDAAVIVKAVMYHFTPEQAMRTIYYEADDILEIHVSDKAIVREASQDWNTTVSYAADGSVVEVVVLEASKQGSWPLQDAA